MISITKVGLLGLLLSQFTFSNVAFGEELRSRLELSIDYPESGITVDPVEPLLLVGNAFLDLSANAGLDAVIAIDVSSSIGIFSGVDIDGDGELERFRSMYGYAGDDSIFAAEIMGVDVVLKELQSERNRVALVSFSGKPQPRPRLVTDNRGSRHLVPWGDEERGDRVLRPAAEVVRNLSGDFSELRAMADGLRARKPWGLTNYEAAIQTSLGALGPRVTGRDQVILFFTDGLPTRPHEDGNKNIEVALAAAKECAKRGVRIHTFAIGQGAIVNPMTLIKIADLTHGYFTPVAEIGDFVDLAAWVARATIQEIKVRNRTTGESATRILQPSNDGSWSALIPLQKGKNHLEVEAFALGGFRVTREIWVHGRSGVGELALPDELGLHRDLLLKHRLSKLRERAKELEERLRKNLVLEMDQTREESQKSIELEVEEGRVLQESP